MVWKKFATTDDGIELWVKTVEPKIIGINVWQSRHPECGWKSGGHADKIGAVVVGAVHECTESDYSMEEIFDEPVNKIPSVRRTSGSTSVPKASK